MLVKLIQRCDRSSSSSSRSVSVNSQRSAVCSQPVAVHSASSPTSQSTVPRHQPVMTRVGRRTPTTSQTDCAAVCTSAPWPSVVPRAVSAFVRLGQSGTLCMSNIMDCTWSGYCCCFALFQVYKRIVHYAMSVVARRSYGILIWTPRAAGKVNCLLSKHE